MVKKYVDEAHDRIYFWCSIHRYGGRGVPRHRDCPHCAWVHHVVFAIGVKGNSAARERIDLLERALRHGDEYYRKTPIPLRLTHEAETQSS